MEIILSKPLELRYKMMVEGAKSIPSARFVLDIGEGQFFSIQGKVVDGIAEIIIPSLKFLEKKLKEKVTAKLEIIVDDRYFEIWSEEVDIKSDIKVEPIELRKTEQEEKVSVELEEAMIVVDEDLHSLLEKENK